MRTFLKFLEQNQPGQVPPTPMTTPQQQTPPPVQNSTAPVPSEDNMPPNPEEDAMLEDLGNQIRRILSQKLFPALDAKKLNKNKATQLLSVIASEIANHTPGMNKTNMSKAMGMGLKMNAEPAPTPPLQPQAQG